VTLAEIITLFSLLLFICRVLFYRIIYFSFFPLILFLWGWDGVFINK